MAVDKQNYFTYIDNTSDDTDKTMENLHKQTIIDGVDVSGDKFALNCRCEKLKAKEQECEELKQKLHQCWTIENSFVEQLDRLKCKEQEYERLSCLIRKTKTYLDVCTSCADEILLYPTISGRTEYTQIEVEEESLKKIIRQFDQLQTENVELKRQHESDKGLITMAGKHNYQLTQEYEKLRLHNEELKEDCLKRRKSDKYEQTLVEIKGMLKLITETNNVYPLQNNLEKILQKIEECEGNDA